MRRLFAVALLLALAAPAFGKTLIVRYGSSGTTDRSNQYADLVGLLNRRGGTFKTVSLYGTRTDFMRTGLQRWGWRPGDDLAKNQEQFDAVVILDFHVLDHIYTGSRPESLTLAGSWPTVPVIFIGNPQANASKWTNAATCSTGVKSLGVGYSTFERAYAMHQVGYTEVWKSLAVSLHPAVVTSSQAGVTFRRIVSMEYSATVPGGAPSTGAILRADPDSIGYTVVGQDSVLMWALYAPGIATAKPIIFLESGTAVPQDVGMMAMALQMADSASGGRVWDASGGKSIGIGLAITATTSKGHYSSTIGAASSAHLGGGVFCRADSCDSTHVLQGLDSLGTLGGLRTTFYADPCSLATYPSRKNWFARAGKYRVGLQTIAGTIASTIATSSDSTAPYDPLGHLRTRFAAPPGVGGFCSQVSDTALVECGLKRSFNILQNYFPDQVDRSLLPAWYDWSPLAYTRITGSPPQDSVVKALYRAGVKAVVTRPEFINTNSSATMSTGVAGTLPTPGTSPTDPWGYAPDLAMLPVYSDVSVPGQLLGRVNLVGDRAQNSANINSGETSGHDVRSELMEGLVQQRWYFQPIRYYTHSFWTSTQVLNISLGRLGGVADGTEPAARQGYFAIKHINSEMQVINRLGYIPLNAAGVPLGSGHRTVFEWKYVSELEPFAP